MAQLIIFPDRPVVAKQLGERGGEGLFGKAQRLGNGRDARGERNNTRSIEDSYRALPIRIKNLALDSKEGIGFKRTVQADPIGCEAGAGYDTDDGFGEDTAK